MRTLLIIASIDNATMILKSGLVHIRLHLYSQSGLLLPLAQTPGRRGMVCAGRQTSVA